MAVCFRLYLMLILVSVVRKAHTDQSKNSESPKSPSRYSNQSTPSSPRKTSLCEAEKMLRKDADKDNACSDACLTFSAKINEFCKQNPKHKTGKSLRNQCGSFNGGTCTFTIPGTDKLPACLCNVPNKKPVYLQICQKSFAPIRGWTTTTTLIKQHGNKFAEHGQKLTEHGKRMTEQGVKMSQKAGEEIRKRTTLRNKNAVEKTANGNRTPRSSRPWKERMRSFTKKLTPGSKVEPVSNGGFRKD